jgi:hypothetical protein
MSDCLVYKNYTTEYTESKPKDLYYNDYTKQGMINDEDDTWYYTIITRDSWFTPPKTGNYNVMLYGAGAGGLEIIYRYNQNGDYKNSYYIYIGGGGGYMTHHDYKLLNNRSYRATIGQGGEGFVKYANIENSYSIGGWFNCKNGGSTNFYTVGVYGGYGGSVYINNNVAGNNRGTSFKFELPNSGSGGSICAVEDGSNSYALVSYYSNPSINYGNNYEFGAGGYYISERYRTSGSNCTLYNVSKNGTNTLDSNYVNEYDRSNGLCYNLSVYGVNYGFGGGGYGGNAHNCAGSGGGGYGVAGWGAGGDHGKDGRQGVVIIRWLK